MVEVTIEITPDNAMLPHVECILSPGIIALSGPIICILFYF